MSHLRFDPRTFADNYERLHFRVQHDLHRHPLFSMESLRALALALPPEDVEMNAGDVPPSLPEGRKPDHRLSVADALEQIEACQTWIGLKKIAQIPAWGRLLDELLDQIDAELITLDPGMTRREGFLFVTSPGSTVPIHVDPEQNFLLQIKGVKRAWLFDKADQRVITQEEIERHYMKANRKLCVRPEVLARGEELRLGPGDGIHIPTMAPHMIQNEGVSVSLSVTFSTPRAKAREDLFRVNHGLRRLGLRPAAVGARPSSDRAKEELARGLRALKRRLVPRLTLYEN